jgi:hypothetical protein
MISGNPKLLALSGKNQPALSHGVTDRRVFRNA